MVERAGVAKSLLTLLDQVDAAFPGRAKGNDGTIGDENHQQTNSDHNRNPEGVICALDITHDPAHGFDAGVFAESLRLNRDQRIKYVIFNGRIFSSTVSPWIWRDRNKGPGDHNEHVHISVGRGPDGHSTNPELYDNTLPWAIDSLPLKPSAPAVALESGRGSWYSQYEGRYNWIDTGDEPGSAALGVPDDAQGLAFYDRSTLGQWFEVHAPNGRVLILQQTDIGPNPRTGRKIDIAAVAAEMFGYTPRNFPTDGVFSWRSAAAPAAVASLSPPQQATAYRDLRKEGVMVEPQAPAGQTDDRQIVINWASIERIAEGIAKFADAMEKRQVGTALPAPPLELPAPAQQTIQKPASLGGILSLALPLITKALPMLGVQGGIWGTVALIAGQALNIIGPATGPAATPTGTTAAAGLGGIFVSGIAGLISRFINRNKTS